MTMTFPQSHVKRSHQKWTFSLLKPLESIGDHQWIILFHSRTLFHSDQQRQSAQMLTTFLDMSKSCLIFCSSTTSHPPSLLNPSINFYDR